MILIKWLLFLPNCDASHLNLTINIECKEILEGPLWLLNLHLHKVKVVTNNMVLDFQQLLL